MSNHAVRPTLDIAAGAAALAEQLPSVLSARGVQCPEDLGWKVIGKRTLLIPFPAPDGEKYLLRLTFNAGREWPPSAQFVNPSTNAYTLGSDKHFLPDLRSPEAQVHPEYDCPGGGKIQLVCCSATYEYYDVLHGGEDAILWRESDTFEVLLGAVGRAFAQHYHGRHQTNA